MFIVYKIICMYVFRDDHLTLDKKLILGKQLILDKQFGIFFHIENIFSTLSTPYLPYFFCI